MLTALYILVGYFFAAGFIIAPLVFREQLASTRWAAYSIINAKFFWTMLPVALVVWMLWLPLLAFAVFAGAWIGIFNQIKTRIRIRSNAEVAADRSVLDVDFMAPTPGDPDIGRDGRA
ncbi:hypothetical protein PAPPERLAPAPP_04490 [Brevundimonas phage vB_BpoS-Papperlapapp]|uniref:Uncharacterized protein n=1 Tax=Brevundimonas phage vB_BpoS-Domovoi TaxID=2948598 RepID=A0A9E7MR34_9CAUD|nr:hypothetical protein DOMOVOI_03440 [Brevundimonas phage vB_BpoS-Domovoi]USN16190.1 hypothetical protein PAPPERLAPAPP_04490 [Brevundimonas phage vB_BpoS-Papperlapapp]